MREKEGRETRKRGREWQSGRREREREEMVESTTKEDGERKSDEEDVTPFSRGSIDASASFVDFRAENADARGRPAPES